MKRLNEDYIIFILDFMRKNSINSLNASNFKIKTIKVAHKTPIYIINYRAFPSILKNIEFIDALKLIDMCDFEINKPTKTIVCYSQAEIIHELKLHKLYNKPIFNNLKEEHKYYKEINK